MSSVNNKEKDRSSHNSSSNSSHWLLNPRLVYPFEDVKYQHCSHEDVKYEKLAKIGQGTFGEVFKARCRQSKQVVALKKILMDNEKEGFPITALREIKILQVLHHENVVELLEICSSRASASSRYKSFFYLVFEFCEHDLAGLLNNMSVVFNMPQIKEVMKQLMNGGGVMKQLMNGLYYIHKNKILHRDMKAANILITKKGVLKLADFGLARAFSYSTRAPNRYTNRVVTLWYRPPELLLGDRNYGPSIDQWGAGLIMAEMWTRSPIMQGTTEQNQLTLISQLCGSINEEVWPGVEHLDIYKSIELPQGLKRKVKERLRYYIKDHVALDLLDKFLTLDPNKRCGTNEALNHDFFWTEPKAAPLAPMLSKLSTSMFEYLAPPKRPNPQLAATTTRGYAPYPPPAVPKTVHPCASSQHFERTY